MKNWTDHIRTLAKFEDNIGKQVAFETSASMLDDLHKENDELKQKLETAERELDEMKANIDHLMKDCHRFTDKRLNEFAIEQQIKGIYEATNYVADNNDISYLPNDFILELCEKYAEQLRQQLNGDDK